MRSSFCKYFFIYWLIFQLSYCALSSSTYRLFHIVVKRDLTRRRMATSGILFFRTSVRVAWTHLISWWSTIFWRFTRTYTQLFRTVFRNLLPDISTIHLIHNIHQTDETMPFTTCILKWLDTDKETKLEF